MSLCDEQSIGRLIIDHEKFRGSHYVLSVVRGGYQQIEKGKLDAVISGNYVLFIPRCNHSTPYFRIEGEAIWKSYFGLLNGFEFLILLSQFIFTIAYLAVVVFYRARLYWNTKDRNGMVKSYSMAYFLNLFTWHIYVTSTRLERKLCI